MSQSHPIITPKLYAGIFATLLGFTALTVFLSNQHLGRWEIPVALGIASVKTLLVALFFMHLWYSTRLTWLAMGTALAFFAILIGGVLSDYLTRNWMPQSSVPPPPAEVRPQSPAH